MGVDRVYNYVVPNQLSTCKFAFATYRTERLGSRIAPDAVSARSRVFVAHMARVPVLGSRLLFRLTGARSGGAVPSRHQNRCRPWDVLLLPAGPPPLGVAPFVRTAPLAAAAPFVDLPLPLAYGAPLADIWKTSATTPIVRITAHAAAPLAAHSSFGDLGHNP